MNQFSTASKPAGTAPTSPGRDCVIELIQLDAVEMRVEKVGEDRGAHIKLGVDSELGSGPTAVTVNVLFENVRCRVRQEPGQARVLARGGGGWTMTGSPAV